MAELSDIPTLAELEARLNAVPGLDAQALEAESIAVLGRKSGALTAILRRIGKWYHAVRESLEGIQPASHLTANRNVMLTRRDRTLYVHLNKDPLGDGVKLKPFNVAPRRATLLNTGRPIECAVNLTPADHQEQKAYLRLLHLPVNELANTVLVAKLEFDRPLEELIQPASGPDSFTEWQ